MKIVIFIDWFWPAYKGGGPIQSIVNLVNQPYEGVNFKIICSNKDLDGEPVSGVSFDQWVPYNEQTKVWYCSENKTIISVLKSVSRWKPDIFFINGIYSFYYNFLPLIFGKAQKKIISARGMLHPGALSQKSFKKNIYLSLLKRFFRIHKKNSFHATNTDEENFIRTVFGSDCNIYVAPNFPRIFSSISRPEKKKNQLQLVSVGLISPMKNYLEVIKSLSYCPEQVDYSIYGPVKDPLYWQQCTDQLKKLPSNINVQYKGDLPSNSVLEALGKSHVFVLPSKSENFGHAIFEALTAGKPVITSHNTPWNNLETANAGFNVAVENLTEVSEAISFFAKADNETMLKWSASAKAYAEQAININYIAAQYKKMFTL